MAFKNAARFKGKISKLPKAVGDAVRQAMEEGAEEIVQAMRRFVPVDTGALRDSINWCWGDPPADAKVITQLKRSASAGINDNHITIFAGDFDAYYARWVEFGTRARAPGAYRDEKGHRRNAGTGGHAATQAKPFFYPIWRAYKKRLATRITRNVNAAIKKVAAGQG